MPYAVNPMPRPRSLTDDGIAAAALAVIDRSGLAGLSMRTVAKELGVGTMSLYRYVEDRAQLEVLVLDVVLSAVDLTRPADGHWHGQVTLIAERIRNAVGAHPAVVPLFLTHRHISAGVMRCGEALLAVLADAGIAGVDRVVAFRTILSYLTGALTTQRLGPLAGAGTAALARLARSDYPLLAQTAAVARGVTADEEFRRGLAAVLHGIASPAARDRSPGTEREFGAPAAEAGR